MPAIDWNGPLKTRAGKLGTLLSADGYQAVTGDTRRRVRVFHHGSIGGDPSKDPYTIWLAHEDGHVRGDGAESPNDILAA